MWAHRRVRSEVTMTRSTIDSMDASAFETELDELVAQARRQGTDVRGTYDMRTPNPNEPNYTVEITEVVGMNDW
jgi:hypothetical protein